MFEKIRQRFCKHNYRKHYSPELNGYNQRCTKCEKEIERKSKKETSGN